MRYSDLQYSIAFLLLFGTTMVFQSCDQRQQSAGNVTDTLKIDGSSTVYPMTAQITNEYTRDFGDLQISTMVSGTGGGFYKFAKGQIDINNASREINAEEKAACKSNGIDYRVFKVALDGIAIVVNKKNDWTKDLTVEELSQIWSNENTLMWSDVRPDWPGEKITLYCPGEASGTFDFFKEALLKDGNYRTDIRKSENDNLLALGVGNDINALGFFALSYFEENKDKLNLVAIDNGSGSGPILPNISSINSGKYEPLSRPLFIYVNEKTLEKPVGKKFVRFYLNQSASAASKVGYVSLSNHQYAQDAATF